MVRFRQLDAFRFQIFPVIFAVLTLFALSFGGSTGAAPAKGTPPPDLDACQNLTPPPGHKVAFHTYAEGVQIYRWNGVAWVFQGPEALLYKAADGAGVIGTHYAGPTWESHSGSKVVGAVVERCTADADSIPWLLLRAVSTNGPGIFQRTTYIQRVNTTGGLAPEEPGDYPGQVAEAPYTAEYYFYRASNGSGAAR
jgi:hypothetical protein